MDTDVRRDEEALNVRNPAEPQPHESKSLILLFSSVWLVSETICKGYTTVQHQEFFQPQTTVKSFARGCCPYGWRHATWTSSSQHCLLEVCGGSSPVNKHSDASSTLQGTHTSVTPDPTKLNNDLFYYSWRVLQTLSLPRAWNCIVSNITVVPSRTWPRN